MKAFRTALLLLFVAAIAPQTLRAAATSDGTAIEQAAPEADVRVVTGGIEVSNPSAEVRTVEVYSITGTMAGRRDIGGGDSVRIELAPGIYIVRVADKAVRVFVR